MPVLALIALLAQTAVPSPTAMSSSSPAPPGWTSTPIEGSLSAYTRRESDGSISRLLLRKQICDCQPGKLNDELVAALSQQQGAVLKRVSATVCGAPADGLIATGLFQPGTGRQNFVEYSFRAGDALITQMYTFSQAAPMPDAVGTLQSLCP
jgi:hypothetical protein